MIENELKKIGFTDNLSTVYLALLKLGKAKAGDIIKQTSLHRSVVYSALDELGHRDLISVIEVHGVAVYSANDPDSLVREAEEKKKITENIALKIKEEHGATPREVSVTEGWDAVKWVTDRSLLAPQGETMYVLGAGQENIQPLLDEHWRKYYHKQRVKKGIKFKGLYDHTVPASAIEYRNSMADSEARYLPHGLDMPVWFNICTNVVSIVVPGEDPPLVFTIKSKATADALKKYFEFLWGLSKN